MNDEILEAMSKLAEQLRIAARGIRDGYYEDDTQRASNNTRRETLYEIASVIEMVFPGPR